MNKYKLNKWLEDPIHSNFDFYLDYIRTMKLNLEHHKKDVTKANIEELYDSLVDGYGYRIKISEDIKQILLMLNWEVL